MYTRHVLLAISIILGSACNSPRPIVNGLYISTSSIIPDYSIQLNPDSTYTLHYRFHLLGLESSGVWSQGNGGITLTSNVEDTASFPLSTTQVPTLPNEEEIDYLVFENLDIEHNNWFLQINSDTIYLLRDTVYTEHYLRPYVIRLTGHPISLAEVNKLPLCDYTLNYTPPTVCTVQSQPIKIQRKGGVKITVDSVFGKRPFNYRILRNVLFYTKKDKVKDTITGVWLKLIDSPNTNSY